MPPTWWTCCARAAWLRRGSPRRPGGSYASWSATGQVVHLRAGRPRPTLCLPRTALAVPYPTCSGWPVRAAEHRRAGLGLQRAGGVRRLRGRRGRSPCWPRRRRRLPGLHAIPAWALLAKVFGPDIGDVAASPRPARCAARPASPPPIERPPPPCTRPHNQRPRLVRLAEVEAVARRRAPIPPTTTRWRIGGARTSGGWRLSLGTCLPWSTTACAPDASVAGRDEVSGTGSGGCPRSRIRRRLDKSAGVTRKTIDFRCPRSYHHG